MKWMHLLCGLMWLVCSAGLSHGQNNPTRFVGLLDFDGANSVQCQALKGQFEWVIPGADTDTRLGALEGVQRISRTPSGYALTTENGVREAEYIILRPITRSAAIRLISERTGYRQYRGAVHFYRHLNRHCIVLETELEAYLQGVLVNEVGKGHAPAFYEAHAMMSRTYAMGAAGRHRLMGFDLCDQEHCQVFDGVSTVNDTIEAACFKTQGLVLVDRLGRPITAAFHSNCGGMTRNAETVWQKPAHYLVSRTDSSCSAGTHARWTRMLSAEAWLKWLTASPEPNEVETRAHFGWPSAVFDVRVVGDSARVTGRGFGHGVGLCQEGAMRRAQEGQSPWAILSSYYAGIRIVPMHRVTTPPANGAWDR